MIRTPRLHQAEDITVFNEYSARRKLGLGLEYHSINSTYLV